MLFLVNGSLTCSQRSPPMEARSTGQVLMTPRVGRQHGKAEVENQLTRRSWVQEEENVIKKNKKGEKSQS